MPCVRGNKLKTLLMKFPSPSVVTGTLGSSWEVTVFVVDHGVNGNVRGLCLPQSFIKSYMTPFRSLSLLVTPVCHNIELRHQQLDLLESRSRWFWVLNSWDYRWTLTSAALVTGNYTSQDIENVSSGLWVVSWHTSGDGSTEGTDQRMNEWVNEWITGLPLLP